MPVHDKHATEAHAREENMEGVAHHRCKYFLSKIGAGHRVLRKIHSLNEGIAGEPQRLQHVWIALALRPDEQRREIRTLEFASQAAGEGVRQQVVAAHDQVRPVPLHGSQR